MHESYDILINEESDKLLDTEQLTQEAIKAVENNGIVFLDEIDKICVREGRVGADVSREGVQRDLLPLIEGTTVATKHGSVKTDHILFIASGAFHISKPSDLLPELQGRLPIRVELKPLTRDDMRRILTEPEASLIKQYIALMATEGVTLEFSEDAIDAVADIAVAVNSSVENIGARPLADGDGARARRSVVRRARPLRRHGEDRRRLRAKARRRPRQERGFEPVYSVMLSPTAASRCSSRALGDFISALLLAADLADRRHPLSTCASICKIADRRASRQTSSAWRGDSDMTGTSPGTGFDFLADEVDQFLQFVRLSHC